MSHFLREKLLNNHDKKTCVEIAQWAKESQSRFNQLLDLTLSDDKKISSRASWPLIFAPLKIRIFWKVILKN